MAVDTRGTKGQPYFDNTQGFDLGADQSAISDYAALTGNYIADGSANRTSLYGWSPWEGLRYFETDTGKTYLFKGAAWRLWEQDWTSYTPTFTSLVQGSGAVLKVQYRVDSGNYRVRGTANLGSSGFSVTGSIQMSLPTNADGNYNAYLLGDAAFLDFSASQMFKGIVALASASTVFLFCESNAGGYSQRASTSATVPFTWAGGDTIQFDFEYTPA